MRKVIELTEVRKNPRPLTQIQLDRGAIPLSFPIKVEQRASGEFRVTYGQWIRDYLNYADAAHEFGECIFHALACEGLLDNSDEEDE